MADKNHILKKFFYDRISVLLCNLGMLKDKTERKLTGPTEARKFKFSNQIFIVLAKKLYCSILYKNYIGKYKNGNVGQKKYIKIHRVWTLELAESKKPTLVQCFPRCFSLDVPNPYINVLLYRGARASLTLA